MRLRRRLRQSPAMANRRREGRCAPAGVLRDAPAQAGKRLAGPEAVCFLGSPRPPGRGSRGESRRTASRGADVQ